MHKALLFSRQLPSPANPDQSQSASREQSVPAQSRYLMQAIVNESKLRSVQSASNASLLRVSRIVGGVDVIDLPRTDAVDLDNRPVVKPSGVFHPSGPEAIRPRGQRFRPAAVKIITHGQKHH